MDTLTLTLPGVQRIQARAKKSDGSLALLPPGSQCNWSTDNPAVASLDVIPYDQSICQITGIGAGSATVTANVVLPDQRTFSKSLTVTVLVDVADIELVAI